MTTDNGQIEHFFSLNQWSEARALILKLLEREPASHWLLTRLSTTYYEEKQYDKALEYIKQALALAPNCPLVLWDFATTLDMLGRATEAIEIFKKLIKKGPSRIAHGECGEGIRWARSLVNDSRYRVGLLFAGLGEYKIAARYIKTHVTNRNRNTPSIYPLREIKHKLAAVIEGTNPR